MPVNKVIRKTTNGTETLIDLTGDSVTPATLAEWVTAHDKSGNKITGTMTTPQIRGSVSGSVIELEGTVADGTYTFVFNMDSGNSITLCTATLKSKAYTDLVPTALDYNGNILNGVGYMRAGRLNAASGTAYAGKAFATSVDKYTAIGLLPSIASLTATIYIYGLDFLGNVGDKIALYNDDANITCRYVYEKLNHGTSDGKVTCTKLADHYYKFDLSFVSNIRRVAFSGTTALNSAPVVTLNEPIF